MPSPRRLAESKETPRPHPNGRSIDAAGEGIGELKWPTSICRHSIRVLPME